MVGKHVIPTYIKVLWIVEQLFPRVELVSHKHDWKGRTTLLYQTREGLFSRFNAFKIIFQFGLNSVNFSSKVGMIFMPFAFDAEIFHYKEDSSAAIRFFLLLGCQSIQCFRSENRLFSGQILGRSTSPHKSTECQYFWPTVSRCVIPPENISSIHIVKTELQSNRTTS